MSFRHICIISLSPCVTGRPIFPIGARMWAHHLWLARAPSFHNSESTYDKWWQSSPVSIIAVTRRTPFWRWHDSGVWCIRRTFLVKWTWCSGWLCIVSAWCLVFVVFWKKRKGSDQQQCINQCRIGRFGNNEFENLLAFMILPTLAPQRPTEITV